MSRLKWLAAGALGLVVLVLLSGVGTYAWARGQVTAVFAKTLDTHRTDFPVPFPLTDAEIDALRAEKAAALPDDTPDDHDPLEGVDLDAIALERAQARGKHFVESIYVCTSCHGADLGGGRMIDDGAIGTVLGPNITPGGRAGGFSPADFDQVVRHGVLPGGATSVMPVLDFKYLSDRELSDIVAHLRRVPAKEGGATVREWGPIGTMLIAFGKLVPDAHKVADHHAPHAVEPPPVGVTLEYGRHISAVCTGCHRDDFAGGPMPFGPPDWPAAANLTPHADGMKGWTFEQFDEVMRKGMGPDGAPVRMPMNELIPFANNMTDTEREAMFLYFQSLPPLPLGE